MITKPLEPPSKLRANVRPVKHAYFISSRSRKQLLAAISYCCTQWGGIRNLIIPLDSKLTIDSFCQYSLQLHGPDVFVSFLSADSVPARRRHERLRSRLAAIWPARHIPLHRAGVFINHDNAAHPLSVLSDQDLAVKQLTVPRVVGVAREQDALLALFGRIYPGQEEEYDTLLGVGTVPVGLDSLDFWERQFVADPFSSPLNLTAYGVSAYEVVGSTFEEAHFEAVLGDSIEAICLFWNLRATRESVRFRPAVGRRQLLIPPRLIDDRAALVRLAEFIARANPPPGVTTNLDLRVYWTDRALAERWSLAARRVRGFRRLRDRVTVSRQFGRREEERHEKRARRPVNWAFLRIPLPESFVEGVHYEIPKATPLVLGDNEIRLEPPPRFTNRFQQQVILDLDSEVWGRFPRVPAVASRIHGDGFFSRYGVSFIAVPAPTPSEFRISLPGEWETIELFFAHHGFQVRESRQSQFVDRIVTLLGGLDRVEAIGAKPTYLLLDALALRSSKKVAHRVIMELGLRDVTEEDLTKALEDIAVMPELKRVPKTLRQLRDGPLRGYRQQELLQLLGILSKAGFIRRGFHLPCDECGTRAWHPLGGVDEWIRCSGCGETFPLPVEFPQGSEIQWEYTLNSLVNRAWDQDVFPALLALAHVAKTSREETLCKCAGLELLRDGRIVAELDWVVMQKGSFLAGECKSGPEIREKDLRTAEVAFSAGVSEFYFCTVRVFSERSKEAVAALGNRVASMGKDAAIRMLDGTELLGEPLQ